MYIYTYILVYLVYLLNSFPFSDWAFCRPSARAAATTTATAYLKSDTTRHTSLHRRPCRRIICHNNSNSSITQVQGIHPISSISRINRNRSAATRHRPNALAAPWAATLATAHANPSAARSMWAAWPVHRSLVRRRIMVATTTTAAAPSIIRTLTHTHTLTRIRR